jgi:hypothetical protein
MLRIIPSDSVSSISSKATTTIIITVAVAAADDVHDSYE